VNHRRCFTLNKHDRYVQRLYDRIKDDYDAVERNVVLSTKKCRKAEIDIIAYKDDEVHVFEVKCSYRFVKAKKQILRILRLLKPVKPTKAYFYCGSADRLERIAEAHY
jgi:predicted RecB family endonuclease